MYKTISIKEEDWKKLKLIQLNYSYNNIRDLISDIIKIGMKYPKELKEK